MPIIQLFSAHAKNKDAVSKFLLGLERQNKSHHTIVNYAQDLKRFLSWLKGAKRRKIWRVKSSDIGDYLQSLGQGDQALAVASRKRHMSTLKNFYEFLIQTGWRPSPWPWARPMRQSPLLSKVHYLKLKESDRTPTPMLPYKEWLRVEEAGHRMEDKLALALLYFGGLRLKELAQLKWEDFSQERKSLRFWRKGGKVQELPLQEFELIWPLVEKARGRQRPPSPYVFKGRQLRSLSARALYSRIKGILRKARTSPSISPHSFRKACATHLYLRTKDLLLVRDYLNHQDAKVTQTYIDSLTLENARMKNTVDLSPPSAPS